MVVEKEGFGAFKNNNMLILLKHCLCNISLHEYKYTIKIIYFMCVLDSKHLHLFPFKITISLKYMK